MNVMTLVVRGQDSPVALACGECGTVHRLDHAEWAERCCAPRECNRCGEEVEHRSYLKCERCRGAEGREREAARLSAATVVPWDDAAGAMLWDEENERWINATEDAEEGYPPTRYAYATRGQALHIDASDIVENAVQDHHDDAMDNIGDAEMAELQAFLDDWCRRTGVVSWYPDYSRVVVFDRGAAPAAQQEGE